jgi:hypothetical protein
MPDSAGAFIEFCDPQAQYKHDLDAGQDDQKGYCRFSRGVAGRAERLGGELHFESEASKGNPVRGCGAAEMKSGIRILVAEDHLIARVGVTSIINSQPDMMVVDRIAHRLNIADTTAKNHVTNIPGKLRVQNPTQAATAAIQRGMHGFGFCLSRLGGFDEAFRKSLMGRSPPKIRALASSSMRLRVPGHGNLVAGCLTQGYVSLLYAVISG